MSVKFHFLNVGGGDCTFIHFPERTRSGTTIPERLMMVDINHRTGHEDYEDVLAYYKKTFRRADGTLLPIFRLTCTHPHQDHICGLAEFLNDPDVKVFNFWDLDHSFEPEDFDHHDTHDADWKKYRSFSAAGATATYLKLSRESKPANFWGETAEGDRISILSPSAELVRAAHFKDDGSARESHDTEIDEMSYALLIHVNDRRVLLAGDGRSGRFWQDIHENCADKIQNIAVLKAGHHGQECSFHEEAVKLMNPAHIIFSNCFEDDDECGGEDLYKEAAPDAEIIKTCVSGTVVLEVPFDKTAPITYTTKWNRLAQAVVRSLLNRNAA